MTGIIPDKESGALPIRDKNGNPIEQPEIVNGYQPNSTFKFNCELSYLPSTCSARITSAQINAFQAEIICLAEEFDPQMHWDCQSLCNLSKAYSKFKGTLGDLAYKNKITVTDIDATGTPNGNSILAGNGTWKSLTEKPSKLAYEFWDTNNPVNGLLWNRPEGVTALIAQIQAEGGKGTFDNGKAYAGGGGGYVEVYLNNPPDQLHLNILPAVIGFYQNGQNGAFAYPGASGGRIVDGKTLHGLGGETRINQQSIDITTIQFHGQSGYLADTDLAIGGSSGNGNPCINSTKYSETNENIWKLANNYGAGGDATPEFQRAGGKGYIKFIYIYGGVIDTESGNGGIPFSRRVDTTSDLTGGGPLTSDLLIGLSNENQHSLQLANTSVQPNDLGNLASKDTIQVTDISASGLSNSTTYLDGSGVWSTPQDSTKVPLTRNIIAGTGLTGGGNLSEDRTISLSDASIASLAKADTALQPGNLASFIPVGVIVPFAGSTVPSGWLLCNGSAISRTQYAALYSVLGSTYGAGNGSTTFNIPDFRGTFLRGLDDGRGIDTGRVLGSLQQDAIQNIMGQVNLNFGQLVGNGTSPTSIVNSATGAMNINGISKTQAPNPLGLSIGSLTQASSFKFDASGSVRTATETRPINLAINYIIKT